MRREQLQANISGELLSDFSKFLNTNLGLYYPERAWSEFEKKIPRIAESFGFDDQRECIRWLINQPVTKDLITALAEHLTIGETYFFRDNDTFKLLRNEILEPLINERRKINQKQIKIWSAACCTGEEPYTIAMILREMLPNILNWNISIMGSDINLEFLRKAKRGVYRDWALRAIPEEYLKKYFVKEADGFAISSTIKNMVRFSYLNLIEDEYPSLTNGTNNIDLILCNNVLIYFSEVQSKRVVTKLEKSLTDGGHLCVTPIEASTINMPTLDIRSDIGCNIFRSNKIAHFKKNKENLLKNISRDIHQYSKNVKRKSVFFENFLKEGTKLENSVSPDISVIKTPEQLDENELYERINSLSKSGDFHQVIKEIEDYLQGFMLNGNPCGNLMKSLIKAHVNIGQLERAKELCEDCIANDSTNPSLHYLHAAIYQEYNCMEEAVGALKKAIFLDGDFSIAYFTMGNILLAQDDFYEARKNFRNVVITLDKLDDESPIPEAEELTAGKLKGIVEKILTKL